MPEARQARVVINAISISLKIASSTFTSRTFDALMFRLKQSVPQFSTFREV
jgi:hypothetical protein